MKAKKIKELLEDDRVHHLTVSEFAQLVKDEEFDIDVWYEENMTIIGKMFEPFPKFAEHVTS